MAIGYTPQTWVNGSAPALSAANLQTMDNGINSACDALDAMAVDGTGIPDATTAIKGRVALATTGVEEATKVPKATGADLAALLTAGGYTLTAPSGANSLDGIADTATWKKVAAAVATALNAGTYNAAKCTAFGIGALATTTMEISCDNYTSGGFFKDPGNITNSPWGNAGVIAVFPYDANNTYQIAFDVYVTRQIKIRQKSTTWSAWYEIWNAYSDGNGGQPPAPKPRSATGAGNLVAINGATNTAVNFPAGGQWVGYYWYFNASAYTLSGSEAIKFGAGGSECAPAVGSSKAIGFMWRITE